MGEPPRLDEDDSKPRRTAAVSKQAREDGRPIAMLREQHKFSLSTAQRRVRRHKNPLQENRVLESEGMPTFPRLDFATVLLFFDMIA